MAKISKAWRNERLALGLKQIAAGKTPRIAKDGSVPTHPLVPCPDVPERDVLQEVGDSINHYYHLRMKRLNNGAGKFEDSPNYCSYGIEGGGDFLGWTTEGRHIEIECKRGAGGRLSKEQQNRFDECWKDSAIFIVIHGLAELDYFHNIGWEHLTREQASRNIRWR